MLRGRAGVATALTAALLAASACSSDKQPATPSTRHRAVTPTTARGNGSSSTTRPAHTESPSLDRTTVDALRAHMVDSIAGYTLQPAGASGTGPSSLATA